MTIAYGTEPTVDRPCPPWCQLAPGHPWEGIETDTGRELRIHACDLNDAVSLSVDEYADEPGITGQPEVSLWIGDNEAARGQGWTSVKIRRVAADLLNAADSLDELTR